MGVNVEATLASASALASKAQRSVDNAIRRWDYGDNEYGIGATAAEAVETAFLQLRLLAESLGLHEMAKEIATELRVARDQSPGGVVAYDRDEDGEGYLRAAAPLRRFVAAFGAVYGIDRSSVVSREVAEILRATQYSVTDTACFPHPPESEADVHRRVEAILRCVFPDLLREPPINKPIKNFRPDTGLPSIRTLIEYKFARTQGDVSRIADELLADTQGFQSSDWSRLIFVIYETRRLRSETEWNELLDKCGASRNTLAVVLCGEPAASKSDPPSRESGKAEYA